MEEHRKTQSATHATVRQCTRTTAIAVGLTLAGRQRLRDGVPAGGRAYRTGCAFFGLFFDESIVAAMQKLGKFVLSLRSEEDVSK
jgi:hypothetical protein